MKTILLIDLTAAVVVNVALFPQDAVVSQSGSAVVVAGADIEAPAGARWYEGEGAIGWAWNGTEAVAPSAPPVDLVAYAADRRWKQETGGIMVGVVPVATDDRSKLLIACARIAAAADPDWSTVWHGTNGTAYPVDAAAMIAISDAVQAHVNAGFTIFATVKAAIDAGEITAMAEIDAAFA